MLYQCTTTNGTAGLQLIGVIGKEISFMQNVNRVRNDHAATREYGITATDVVFLQFM